MMPHLPFFEAFASSQQTTVEALGKIGYNRAHYLRFINGQWAEFSRVRGDLFGQHGATASAQAPFEEWLRKKFPPATATQPESKQC